MCDRNLVSETKDHFQRPKLKKPTTTRSRRYEQFLWQELYDEYIRHKNTKEDLGRATTEYYDEYCKDMPPEDEAAKEATRNRYPLYCTTAITLWNHGGDVTKDFKKRYSITRPITECTEQFG